MGDAGGSQDRGKTGRLDAEVTEDRDDQNDIQSDRDDRADVAQQRRIDLLALQGGGHQANGKTDEPTADQIEDDRTDDLEAHEYGDVDNRLHGLIHVDGMPLLRGKLLSLQTGSKFSVEMFVK